MKMETTRNLERHLRDFPWPEGNPVKAYRERVSEVFYFNLIPSVAGKSLAGMWVIKDSKENDAVETVVRKPKYSVVG